MASPLPGLAPLALALSLLATAPAQAQPVPAAPADRPRADPVDPAASVPPAIYRSVFSAYRPAVEQPVGAWRELNDQVGRIGGWRAYAREASAPAVPPAAASAPKQP